MESQVSSITHFSFSKRFNPSNKSQAKRTFFCAVSDLESLPKIRSLSNPRKIQRNPDLLLDFKLSYIYTTMSYN